MTRDVLARGCLSRSAYEDLAGKWAGLAVLALGEGAQRFSELRRRVDGVSEKMLSQTLQALERDGLVHREVVTAIPPRVVYSLTPLGHRLRSPLRAFADLLEETAGEIGKARENFDAVRGARS